MQSGVGNAVLVLLDNDEIADHLVLRLHDDKREIRRDDEIAVVGMFDGTVTDRVEVMFQLRAGRLD